MRKLKKLKIGRKVEKGRESKILSSLSSFSDRLVALYRKKFVYRLFWGRSNLYRNVIHVSILLGTSFLFLTGFSNRFFAPSQVSSSINASNSAIGNIDLLEQGGNIKTILLANGTGVYQIFDYQVKEGDSYDSIASTYGIEAESIKLSNLDTIAYYDKDPKVGSTLRIPEINGVLIRVGDGETLDSIMGKVTQGDRNNVIETNGLTPPEYKLTKDQFVLIPDGRINPPARPIPQIRYSAPPAPAPIPSPSEAVFAGVQFINPLSHPGCNGYGYNRGFTGAYAHNGVDLAKGGGCPIRAAAAGTVRRARWTPNEGYNVVIDHGNGVETLYFHGNGDMWVKPGQYIGAGTDIMYMGATGRVSSANAVHLHFSLRYNGVFIDPAPYVPYWRP